MEINTRSHLHRTGPLLIAANHPNSFLDAVIVATLFKKPVYSLARGDVFRGGFVNRLLHSLNMLPVYRISEGAENLGHNYTTFESCKKIFQQGGIVLIFSEGRCINEWRLRPLKKGTARLALSAWEEGAPLEVLPLGINYSSFRKYGKKVILNFGNPIQRTDIDTPYSGGKAIQQFNETLERELKEQVYELHPQDLDQRKKLFEEPVSLLKRVLLFLPALAGLIIHAPFYFLVDGYIRGKSNDHYDSILVGLLFFGYPVLVLLLTLVVYWITGNLLALLLFVGIPATGMAYLHFRNLVN
ncbi:MAG: 1-acyl-sn-glycerol-3-phosphate acyltransferase [Bacteroidota bacterium]|nr:1-acyl-sn-glycerol-3-phosphate acyltransferase [Bacteroidota bacterium]